MANVTHDEMINKKALASAYREKINGGWNALRSRLTKPQEDFIIYRGRSGDTRIYDAFSSGLREQNALPSKIIERELGWMFGSVVSEKHREVISYYADKITEYPYSDSYARRSFRSKNKAFYATKLCNLVCGFCGAAHHIVDLPLSDILSGNIPEDMRAYLDLNPYGGSGYCSWQIAYALDTGDTESEEEIRRILTEDNAGSKLTHELIKGVLCSHRSDFHELVGKLLVAARLQEGLRQSICEAADCGTEAAFLMILKVIEENNLIRFSAVKRAVGTWLGILSEEVRDLERVSDKSVRLIIDCLSDEALREEYLAGEDAMKIYVALWSLGFKDIGNAVSRIDAFTKNGSRHQLLVCGYFSDNLDLAYPSNNMAKRVLKLHREEDVIAVWLPSFLPNVLYEIHDAVRFEKPIKRDGWFEDTAEVKEYYSLIKEIYSGLSSKTKVFSPCIFPWHEVKLSKSALAVRICALAVYSEDADMIDEACAYIKECDTGDRWRCFSILLSKPKSEAQRRAVIEALADKESNTRRSAYEIVSKMDLTSAEYRKLQEYLRFKSADLRKYSIEILMKQKDGALSESIGRMLASPKEEIRLGALDMLLGLKKDEERGHIYVSFLPALEERMSGDLPSKEKILLESLLPAKSAKKEVKRLYTPEDKYIPTEFDPDFTELCVKTFEDYFPESKIPSLIRETKKGAVLGKLKDAMWGKVACKTSIVAAADLVSLSKFIEEHKTVTFKNRAGEEVLLGNTDSHYGFITSDNKLPLPELWDEWAKERGITYKRALAALVLSLAYKTKSHYSEASAEYVRQVFGVGFEFGHELPYSAMMGQILSAMVQGIPTEDSRRLGSALALWFIKCVPDEDVMIYAPVALRLKDLGMLEYAHLLAHDQIELIYKYLVCPNNDELKYLFPLLVACAERCVDSFNKHWKPKTPKPGMEYYHQRPSTRALHKINDGRYLPERQLVGAKGYIIAAYRGVITRAQMYEFILQPDNIPTTLATVSAAAIGAYDKDRLVSSHSIYLGSGIERRIKDLIGKNEEPTEEDMKFVHFVAGIYDELMPVVLASELSRGDSPAEYSGGILSISRIYGADTFAGILDALGNDTLDRSSYYGYSYSGGRRTTLSYLLSVCIPNTDDSAETLRRALDGKQISKKRLIEAALYSPEWIGIVGEYLGIESFESVCYYFMAHMNERFDNKRRAMIARFTPLAEEELNLGAFDVNWFRSAYSSIGEAEFDLIYDAAKYISDGAKHSRARKYADASLGKLSVDDTEAAVADKRNKDLLMAYSLIPLAGEDDLCRRYLYIQKFRKESRKFGAQRIASEGKAAETALKNLATNAGYADVMRLTLRMETKVIDDSRRLFDETAVGDVTMKITFDETGKARVQSFKDGKELKSVPARLKKDAAAVEILDMVKKLNDQYKRTRVMLEEAMEDGTVFTFGELSALSSHPVVYPMLSKLVLVGGGKAGFLTESGLCDSLGVLSELMPEDEVRIAHPVDLYKMGCWRDCQRYLYDNRVIQPFRQVFRELYVKTEDEIGTYRSLRYSGHQVQPARTLAVLKSRRWVADVEDGLQKVYYKENIVARIYALADWFSPADIEAPTLEFVCFSDRNTGDDLKIDAIPDIIFSEVMRDVDLAVSVAHAGGVDPEASHSTVEMRAAILSFLLPMFRIENVTVEGHHAVIKGKVAEYSIHLGSGVVHQLGGAMIPVLPVHSQHRGKIFLPFVDDDPKTAEIISKVLLFADDAKIKDPTILAAIAKY